MTHQDQNAGICGMNLEPDPNGGDPVVVRSVGARMLKQRHRDTAPEFRLREFLFTGGSASGLMHDLPG